MALCKSNINKHYDLDTLSKMTYQRNKSLFLFMFNLFFFFSVYHLPFNVFQVFTKYHCNMLLRFPTTLLSPMTLLSSFSTSLRPNKHKFGHLLRRVSGQTNINFTGHTWKILSSSMANSQNTHILNICKIKFIHGFGTHM